MAEFCKECAGKYLGMTKKELRRAVMSDELDLCEGCGQYRPVVVRLRPTLATRWDNLGYKLRKRLENRGKK